MVSICSLRFGIQSHLSLPDAFTKHPLRLGDRSGWVLEATVKCRDPSFLCVLECL